MMRNEGIGGKEGFAQVTELLEPGLKTQDCLLPAQLCLNSLISTTLSPSMPSFIKGNIQMKCLILK